MADTKLNIVLKLLDQASGEIKEVMDKTGKAADNVKEKSNKAANEANKNFLRLTVTVASLIKAYKLMEQGIQGVIEVGKSMDSSFRDSLNNFELSVQKVQQSIAQKLVPIIKTAADFWADFLNKSFGDDTGFIGDLKKAEKNLDVLQAKLQAINGKKFAFWDQTDRSGNAKEIEAQIAMQEKLIETLKRQAAEQEKNSEFNKNLNLTRSRQELEEYNKVLKDNEVLFATGQISAQQYYETVLNGQTSQVAINQQAARSLNELAAIQAQVNNKQLLEAQRMTNEQISLLNFYKDTYMKAHQSMAAFTVALGQSIQTNLSGALTDFVTGAKTAKEAFAELGQALIRTIVDFMAQKVVAFILEKTLLAGTVAASSAAAAAIGAAWAVPAFLATVATFGAAAAQAPASLASAGALSLGVVSGLNAATKAAQGLGAAGGTKDAIDLGTITVGGGRFHNGGIVRAHNGLAVDEVPIIAQSGEGILSRRGMQALGGNGALDALNRGENAGGQVYVTVNYPKMSSKDEVDALATALGTEIQRQLRYSR